MENLGSKILLAGGVLVVLLVVFIIIGVSLFSKVFLKQVSAQEASVPTTPTVQLPASNAPITINKIIASPVVYKDLTITVEGTIIGWVTKTAVIVSEVGEKNKKNRILVIRNQKFGLPSETPATDVAIGETVIISVTGTTGILNISEGDLSFGDEAETRELRKWNNKPVIFATSVIQK